jgi:hypothetical protein
MTLKETIDSLGITSTYVSGPAREDWAPGASHYTVTLIRPATEDLSPVAAPEIPGFRAMVSPATFEMDIPFSMGSAHTEGPTTEGVLECVISDIVGYENAGGDFGEWAWEYGYDDPRQAWKIWKLLEAQAELFTAWIGDCHDTLLAAELE